jgi:hypothetical protein
MRETAVISFIPPIEGIDGSFNTFRIGSGYFKRLNEGEEVFLMNEKTKTVFGKAVVEKLDNGPMGEMCMIHAHKNHTELNNNDGLSHERLFGLLQKIYGPHIALPVKKVTVIYLRRTECESSDIP